MGETQAKDYYRISFAKRFGRLADRPYLDVHVVDHCNLRCRGCIHFAPLAERRFLDEGDYARDLAMLSGVAGIEGYFRAVVLMGGEPLLHPRLPEVMRLTRRYLPSTPVLLSSNGLLLRGMSDEFWETLVDCGIELTLSSYPLGMDYQALLELARQRGVVAGLASDRTERDRGKEVFFKLALDPTGSQDEQHSFVNCTFGGCYLQLVRGALWPCQVAAHHEPLAQRFSLDMAASDGDCLPLDGLASTGQIDWFRRRPHPLCRFCNNDALEVVEWGRSRLEASEWLADGGEAGCAAAVRKS